MTSVLENTALRIGAAIVLAVLIFIAGVLVGGPFLGLGESEQASSIPAFPSSNVTPTAPPTCDTLIIGKWQELTGQSLIIQSLTFYKGGAYVGVVSLITGSVSRSGIYAFADIAPDKCTLQIQGLDPTNLVIGSVFEARFDNPDRLELKDVQTNNSGTYIRAE